MLKKLIGETDDDFSRLIIRVALGAVIFPHGAQKLLGWFGGQGFQGTVQTMTGLGLPAALVVLVILAESLGSVSLILGFLGRFCAFGIACVMLGAVFMVHGKLGFFMNWFGNKQGEGFEYHLLALGLAVAVMLKGSGRWSLDRLLSQKL